MTQAIYDRPVRDAVGRAWGEVKEFNRTATDRRVNGEATLGYRASILGAAAIIGSEIHYGFTEDRASLVFALASYAVSNVGALVWAHGEMRAGAVQEPQSVQPALPQVHVSAVDQVA